ncbi:putative Transmembrane protein [Quillaja saponaria]|uniref:Transmembrane protein n=1 Tax=Quillaja saponaria TaxID=32244 RepID=A0AAD7PJY6_QUISA|nr:putative Transmembrane protein [Quillaja saponaria]
MAATMAIISAMCIDRFRKKISPPPTSADPLTIQDIDKCSPPLIMAMETTTTITPPLPPQIIEETGPEDIRETENNDTQMKDIPLPPAMKQTGDTFFRNNMEKCRSERRLSMNLSIKLPRSLSVARNWDHKKGKLKTEESIWTKTIILGEKCKVPGEDDAVLYELKGNKIPAFHPRTTSSISVLSRQYSFTDPDSLPCPQPQEEKASQT